MVRVPVFHPEGYKVSNGSLSLVDHVFEDGCCSTYPPPVAMFIQKSEKTIGEAMA